MYGGPSLPIKKTKNNENNNKNSEIKNENKKNEKIKKLLLTKKTPTKISWPMSVKSDNFFLFKKKKTTNYHGP